MIVIEGGGGRAAQHPTHEKPKYMPWCWLTSRYRRQTRSEEPESWRRMLNHNRFQYLAIDTNRIKSHANDVTCPLITSNNSLQSRYPISRAGSLPCICVCICSTSGSMYPGPGRYILLPRSNICFL
ncbi:hypothetical protein K491DRAFT_199667 [Lophiostoma macrostomum CBS 122681]|uniref:Uncharacterized protein n=1 Tax=Lophiostoma macrostomum CBS 122681 TaxID=1314788 RepID=A0A6A6SP49_9PLEO|nr:hypothetical protein K491DRAFT_199667 [Lophiostoma macrostomum CBS 122681]